MEKLASYYAYQNYPNSNKNQFMPDYASFVGIQIIFI